MQTFRNSRMQTSNRVGESNSYGTRQPTVFQPIAPYKLEQFSITELRIYQLLRAMYVLVPLVAGVDKFFYSITDWDRYVPTAITSMHIPSHEIMVAVGVVEVIIACIVAINPRVGALAVMVMLSGIIADLFALPRQLPIALLDACLCVGALCLFLLASRKAMLHHLHKSPG